MSLEPSVPRHLLHLLEKRQKPGRRKEDAGQSKNGVAATSSGARTPANDRRRGQRRKPTPAKSRKA